jgi:hypothetical protein
MRPMLTNNDLKKLRKIFATKEDLKRFATKDDLKRFATKEDLKRFATKEDLKRFATKEDLKRFATKDDLKAYATKQDLKEMLDKLAEEITEIVGAIGEKIDKSLNELRSHRIILGDHEERIKELERNIFSRV